VIQISSERQPISNAEVLLPAELRRRCRPGFRTRWRSRRHAPELDQLLAQGADPLASDELLCRAQMLAEPYCRIGLADTIETVVRLVDNGSPQGIGLPRILRRDVIRRNRRLLLTLADRLRSQGPLDLRGLARAELLVSFGDSAMYRGPGARTLRVQLVGLLAALDPIGACEWTQP
jgi:hypothetical protein